MSYIVVRNIGDLCVQTRKRELSEAIERAEELIETGMGRSFMVCIESDNQEAQKVDWSQPTWKREFVCEVK